MTGPRVDQADLPSFVRYGQRIAVGCEAHGTSRLGFRCFLPCVSVPDDDFLRLGGEPFPLGTEEDGTIRARGDRFDQLTRWQVPYLGIAALPSAGGEQPAVPAKGNGADVPVRSVQPGMLRILSAQT